MLESGIYKLKIGKFYYIGRSNNINSRVGRHTRSLEDGTHYNKFMQRYYDKYGTITHEVIESLPIDDLVEAEQRLIDLHYNDRLCMNLSKSAEYSRVYRPKEKLYLTEAEIEAKSRERSDAIRRVRSTPESREKTSIATKLMWQNPEYIEKVSASIQIATSCPLYRERQREAQLKYNENMAPAERAARSAKVKEVLNRPEVRAKLSESVTKALACPIIRKKMSDGIKESLARPETKELRSEVSIDRWKCPERKARMASKISELHTGKNNPASFLVVIGGQELGILKEVKAKYGVGGDVIRAIINVSVVPSIEDFDILVERYKIVKNDRRKRKVKLNGVYSPCPSSQAVIDAILGRNGYSLTYEYPEFCLVDIDK